MDVQLTWHIGWLEEWIYEYKYLEGKIIKNSARRT